MQRNKMAQLAGALALLTLAACKSDPEEPKNEKTTGGEIEAKAKSAKADIDEATDEATDDVDDEL